MFDFGKVVRNVLLLSLAIGWMLPDWQRWRRR
jgi:hypothetical protein